MKKCSYCNQELETIPFYCHFCGKYFCSRHRLPENHQCNHALVSNSSENLLYSDLSDLIENDLSVADIYYNYTIGEFTKEKTIGLLKYILEKTNEIETRLHCIEAFGALELKDAMVFEILEEIIITDSNKQIKNRAIKITEELFPEKSKKVQEWLEKV